MSDRLRGKVAIITGGGSGIGRGLAIALAQEGAAAVVCGRRKQKLDETVEEIWSQGGAALAVQADISVEADAARVVQNVMDTYRRIDILINNAGISSGGSAHETGAETWDRVMAVNLRGPYLMTRHVLPVMRANRNGHIINISSESGLEYYPGDAAYGTSKHALNAFGEFVQRENQEMNIRVNTICPGMVVSEMTEHETNLDRSKCLVPEDIADLVIWLVTRRPNVKIGTPILIQTMENPWM